METWVVEVDSVSGAADWLSAGNDHPGQIASVNISRALSSAELRAMADAIDGSCCASGSDVFLIDGDLVLVFADCGH